MLKVFSMKNQQKKDANNSPNTSTSSTTSTGTPSSSRSSAAQLRIQKDMNELTLPSTCQLDFPDKDDLLNFKLIICPDEVM